MLLLRTVHGSHLYGTAHAGSDMDYFEVYTNNSERTRARYAKQTITGDLDVLKTDLSTFMQYASKGVPQYLEAMYSTKADVDVLGEAFRFRFRPGHEAIHTYRRTIKSFFEYARENHDPKRYVHALRLLVNLQNIEEGRYFNPTLHPAQVKLFQKISQVVL